MRRVERQDQVERGRRNRRRRLLDDLRAERGVKGVLCVRCTLERDPAMGHRATGGGRNVESESAGVQGKYAHDGPCKCAGKIDYDLNKCLYRRAECFNHDGNEFHDYAKFSEVHASGVSPAYALTMSRPNRPITHAPAHVGI